MALQIRGNTQILSGTIENGQISSSASISLSKLSLSDSATFSGDLTLSSVDVNGGTIDGVTIATSDITVGASKTLNVSAGTLTLADNQISGDKINGGTIDAINIDSVNIDGGSIDGTAIGSSSASSASFTTLGASGAATLQSTLGVTGATTLSSTLTVAGNFSVNSDKFTVNSTSGDASVGGDLSVAGDLLVSGDTVTVNVATLQVEDPLIKLGQGNSANLLDLGFYGLYNDGSDKYAGLFRDRSDSGKFKLFDGLTTEPGTEVGDISSLKGTLVANIEGNITFDNARTFSLSGDLSGSQTFDGSGNCDIEATIVANSVEFSMLNCELDDDTFATASATTVPTSESVKAYVDSQVASGGLSSLEAKDMQMVDSTGSFIKVKEVIVYLEANGTDETNGYVELGAGDAEVEAEFDELSMVFINGQKLRFSTDSNATNDYYFTTDGSSNFKRLVIDGVYNGDDLEIRYLIKS